MVASLTMSASRVAKPLVDAPQVLRRLAEIVVADDPLGLPEPRDAAGDVILQVHVVDAFRDRRPQGQQPGLFRVVPLAAVLLAAAGDDARAGPLAEQAADVHAAADVVHPQLDQLHALFGQVPMLGHRMLVAAATNANANHETASVRRGWKYADPAIHRHANAAAGRRPDRTMCLILILPAADFESVSSVREISENLRNGASHRFLICPDWPQYRGGYTPCRSRVT